jgi:hypothetical protein
MIYDKQMYCVDCGMSIPDVHADADKYKSALLCDQCYGRNEDTAIPTKISGDTQKQIVDDSHGSAFNSGDLINAMLGGNRIPQRGKL